MRRGWIAGWLAAVLALTACQKAIPEAEAEIVMAEFAIASPPTVDAGEQVWRVTNTGETHHTLTVCPGEIGRCDEPGIQQHVEQKDPTSRDPDALPDDTDALVLGAGWTNIVSFDLEPGLYRLWCGIPNHAGKGMDVLLQVLPDPGV